MCLHIIVILYSQMFQRRNISPAMSKTRINSFDFSQAKILGNKNADLLFVLPHFYRARIPDINDYQGHKTEMLARLC